VDSRWSRVRVSTGTDRNVRGLEDIRFFKAHEWKTWLLFWIPVMKGQLDPRILKHLSKFTLGILLLLQIEITREQVEHASDLLHEFCEEFEDVFDLENCVFNVHIHSHAAACVKQWGPLWQGQWKTTKTLT